MAKMTDAQGRIALDLSQVAADRCKQVMLDAMALCDHPMQQWTIGMQIAAQSLGAASGALSKANPDLSYEQCSEAAFSLLTDMVEGKSLTHPRQENEGHG